VFRFLQKWVLLAIFIPQHTSFMPTGYGDKNGLNREQRIILKKASLNLIEKIADLTTEYANMPPGFKANETIAGLIDSSKKETEFTQILINKAASNKRQSYFSTFFFHDIADKYDEYYKSSITYDPVTKFNAAINVLRYNDRAYELVLLDNSFLFDLYVNTDPTGAEVTLNRKNLADNLSGKTNTTFKHISKCTWYITCHKPGYYDTIATYDYQHSPTNEMTVILKQITK